MFGIDSGRVKYYIRIPSAYPRSARVYRPLRWPVRLSRLLRLLSGPKSHPTQKKNNNKPLKNNILAVNFVTPTYTLYHQDAKPDGRKTMNGKKKNKIVEIKKKVSRNAVNQPAMV
jgi:hypothetical protein